MNRVPPQWVLGIESSCDEMAAAVVRDGREIASSCVHGQDDVHRPYGGVVPELACRAHMDVLAPMTRQALDEAGVRVRDLDAIAVTAGPGLIGALLVGVSQAKAMAFALGIPLVAVHHIEAHIAAVLLDHDDDDEVFPAVALVVSGGHTHLYDVKGPGRVRPLGRTRDDAAGEAFDKVAALLRLGYPGGPAIDRLAREGDPRAVAFPRPRVEGAPFDFSFSGLKTAVRRHLAGSSPLTPALSPQGRGGSLDAVCSPSLPSGERDTPRFSPLPSHGELSPESSPLPFGERDRVRGIADVAASFQAAVVDVLVDRTIRAARETGVRNVVVAGGVAANSALRKGMEGACASDGLRLFIPPPALCTDNAAMVAVLGARYLAMGRTASLDLNP
ncbi:MAG: tRNA (adenosine(37)-N6)-threonylcarbamoyltransferase complex transferase subunit TsaD, partial [Nitrospirae bacterium]|nr:tRNA (adenosine(37)-N6)-threonylcarbamoyltransferase complex transferase subunit TsaD [Nitrospirota bacterium]